MKVKQKNKIAMYHEVISVVKKKRTSWISIPEFARTFEEFAGNHEMITGLVGDVSRDLTSIIVEKQNQRQELIDAVVPVSSLLQVYAYNTGDKKLSKVVSYSRSKLVKMKDVKLLDNARNIRKKAGKIYDQSQAIPVSESKKKSVPEKNIKTYGLTADILENIDKKGEVYKQVISKIKEILRTRNRNTKKIASLIKSNDKLLQKKLDKLIALFEVTDKDFFSNYLAARKYKASKAKKTPPAESNPDKPKVENKELKTNKEKPAVARPSVRKARAKKTGASRAAAKQTRAGRDTVNKSADNKTVVSQSATLNKVKDQKPGGSPA